MLERDTYSLGRQSALAEAPALLPLLEEGSTFEEIRARAERGTLPGWG